MTLTVMKRCRVLRTSTPGAQIIILLALFAVKHGNNECNLALDQFCNEDDDRSSPRRFVERAVSALSRNPELANGMMTGPPSMELAEMERRRRAKARERPSEVEWVTMKMTMARLTIVMKAMIMFQLLEEEHSTK